MFPFFFSSTFIYIGLMHGGERLGPPWSDVITTASAWSCDPFKCTDSSGFVVTMARVAKGAACHTRRVQTLDKFKSSRITLAAVKTVRTFFTSG